VNSVTTDRVGQQKLWLAMVKDKVGGKWPKPKVDLSSFKDVAVDHWLPGKVSTVFHYGALVQVQPPSGGAVAQGVVHKTDVQDGFIPHLEDVLSVDDEVQVRVKYVDPAEGVLHLSMIGS